MNLGQKLKGLRLSRGLTQKQMAEILNTASSTIGMYERNERTPSINVLDKYTELFNINLNYFNDSEETESYRTINVIGTVPAGIPIEAIEDILDTEDISFKQYSPNKDYIGLKVQGDSMYPKYLEGDTVIIEVTPTFENMDDCIVYINGYDATLKRVRKNPDNSITIIPLNTQYPPKTYGKAEDQIHEDIKILGVVKELRRKIK